jgi:4-hydroxybenzoate polyprenyltransferase
VVASTITCVFRRYSCKKFFVIKFSIFYWNGYKNEDQKIKLKLMMILSNYAKLIRLNQSTGIWLLFLPCLFGVFLAMKKLPYFDFKAASSIIFLFFIGSFVMRSAGCIINDLFDQKFDEKVTNRPLAAKKISRFDALIMLTLLLITGLVVLLQFNSAAILGGLFAMALVVAYPLMKRITHYPQVFLGITFNFGILISSLVIFERITFDSLILYLSCIIWTVIYDTIYAYQDIESDLKIGIKSTAVKFEKNPKKILTLLSLAMLTLLIFLGLEMRLKIEFFLISALSFVILVRNIQNCNFKNPEKCLTAFKTNTLIGFLILMAIIAG